MPKLFAYGCSLTYGQTLRDCVGETIQHGGPQPSKFAWPQLLADKFGLECVNKSEGGGSNKLALDRLLMTHIKPRDVVIIQWSYLARWCIFDFNFSDDSEQRIDLGPWKKSHPFYKYIWNPIDCLFNNKIIIDFAWLHLKQVGCKFLFSSIEKGQRSYWVEDDLEYVFHEESFNYAKFTDKSIKDFQIDKALDNQHPGHESHRLYAEYLSNLPLFTELTNTK